MMKQILLIQYVLLAKACAFQPSMTPKVMTSSALQSSVPHSAFPEFDPVSNMNMDHAHYCADNFGKCPIKELEDMKKALKTERIQHEALGLTLDPEEELDHRLLEEDLTLQLAILKDEVPTTSLYKLKNPKYDHIKKNSVAAIATPDYYHHDHTLKDYVEEAEELFLLPNGLADAFAFGLALLIIGATLHW